MKSYNLFTDEVDDINIIIDSFKKQLKGITLSANSLGILFYSTDLEYQEFIVKMKECLDIDYVGATTLAMMNSVEGYSNFGVSLLILTADDVEFATGITPVLTEDNYVYEINSICNKLSTGSEDKLVLLLGSKPVRLSGDYLISEIEKVSPGVPIFGGFAGDNLKFSEERCSFNDDEGRDRLVLVYVKGNIKPRFITEPSIDVTADFAYRITKSDGNRVYRLDDISFIEALKENDFAYDKESVIMDYIISPFAVSLKQKDGTEITVSRNISYLDSENGCSTFLGAMPEGSYIKIGSMGLHNIQKSVEKAYEKVSNIIADETEYDYSTCLCISCAARYLLLINKPTTENDAFFKFMDESITMMGMYSFGEFAPVVSDNGNEYNVFHNATFTMMII